MAAPRPCAACKKTVLANDPTILAEGGAYHRTCFKCAKCNGQLTLLNFAAIKGVVYCKPHFVELFKLRGKYDDMDGGSTKHKPAGGAAAGAGAATEGPAKSAAVAAPAAEAPQAEEPKAEEPKVEEPKVEETKAEAAVPAVEPTAAAAAPAAAEPAAAAAAVEGAKVDADGAVLISGLSVKDRIAAARKEVEAHKKVEPEHAGQAVKLAGVGGGAGTKCAVCAKTVYPADPQIGNQGKVYHRTCFKCSHCHGQLSLIDMAAIDGQLFCKPHYVSIFSLRGSYDSLTKGEGGAPHTVPAAEEPAPAAAAAAAPASAAAAAPAAAVAPAAAAPVAEAAKVEEAPTVPAAAKEEAKAEEAKAEEAAPAAAAADEAGAAPAAAAAPAEDAAAAAAPAAAAAEAEAASDSAPPPAPAE